jgi:hypothetical protein
MPLNDDPAAVPDDEYNAELQAFAVEHPMTGPSPDQYELEDEETPNGDPR